MSKCYGCKQDVSGIGLPDLVFTWQEFIMDGGPELLEVPWHKLCYANELSEYNIDNFDAAIARAEQAEAALAELRTEFALAQVALASANVTYTVNRGVGEALAMAEIGDGTYTCDECGGEGVIITCCDDICVGQGYCMHGDGESICPKCDGDGVLSHRWNDEPDTQEVQP